MRYKRKINTKKYLFSLMVLLLVTGVVFAYIQLGSSQESEIQRDESGINFGPPTEEEQQAGDEIKDRIVEEQESTTDNEDESRQNAENKKSADIVIVDANQYDNTIEVRAFVSNHVEDGTCSYQFNRGNNAINKSLPAHADASTTVCPALEVNRSEFSSGGDWQLIVSYESANAKGSSEAQTVTIN